MAQADYTATGVQSATFNGVTYDAGSGGPIGFRRRRTVKVLADRVAGAVGPGFLAIVAQQIELTLTLRDATALAPAPGTKSSLVVVLKTGGGTKTYTCNNAVAMDSELGAGQDGLGVRHVRFLVEDSLAGNPESIA